MTTEERQQSATEPKTGSDQSIIVYGTDWCGDCHRTRRFLDQNQIPYEWVDADDDPRAVDIIRKINNGRRSVPTLVFPDGTVMSEPSNLALGRKLGIDASSNH